MRNSATINLLFARLFIIFGIAYWWLPLSLHSERVNAPTFFYQTQDPLSYEIRFKTSFVYITPSEIHYQIKSKKLFTFKESFPFTKNNYTPLNQMGVFNYFKGKDRSKWVYQRPFYEKIRMNNALPGIDLTLAARTNNLEKIFTILPGSLPDSIQIKLTGIDSLNTLSSGHLALFSNHEKITFSPPKAFQIIESDTLFIQAQYTVNNRPKSLYYGFSVDEYDPERPLYIDPIINHIITGGDGEDKTVRSIAAGPDGSIYIGGQSSSSSLPGASGAYSENGAGGLDLFIMKIDSELNQVTHCTFLGGAGDDGYTHQGANINLAGDGSVLVTAMTPSTDFPTTAGAYQASNSGGLDIIVCKLSSDLSQLLSSTYLGGSSSDFGSKIASWNGNDILISGVSYSTDFPIVGTPYQDENKGSYDLVVAILNNDLTELKNSTYIGGAASEMVWDMSVGGGIILCGHTFSSDFPVSPSAFKTQYTGAERTGFVCYVSSDLSDVGPSTLIGGSQYDQCLGLAHSQDGKLLVCGTSQSGDFEFSGTGLNHSHSGNSDAYALKISTSLETMSAFTFLGGSGDESASGIAVNSQGNICLSGNTSSGDFPITPLGEQTTYQGGEYDGFFSVLGPDLSELDYSTYVGGSLEDQCVDAVYSNGSFTVPGYSYSQDIFQGHSLSDNNIFLFSYSQTSNGPPVFSGAPSPADGETSVSLSPILSWNCEDPESAPLAYDLYISEDENHLDLISTGLNSNQFSAGPLEHETAYFWQVQAHDGVNSVLSPLWSFITLAAPLLTAAPDTLRFNAAKNNDTLTITNSGEDILSWRLELNGPGAYSFSSQSGALSKNESITVNVLLANGASLPSNKLDSLLITSNGGSKTIFLFYEKTNEAPQFIYSQLDSSSYVNTPLTLELSALDDEEDSLYYHIDWGDGLFSEWEKGNFPGDTLRISHSWNVRDSFTIAAAVKDLQGAIGETLFIPLSIINSPPTVELIGPEDGSGDVSLTPTLIWEISDWEEDPAESFVYLDTVTPPSSFMGGQQGSFQYTPPPLIYWTDYFWTIKAFDGYDTTSGPVYHFKTRHWEWRYETPPRVAWIWETKCRLTWTLNREAVCTLYYSLDSLEWKKIGTEKSVTRSLELSSLSPNSKYFYKLSFHEDEYVQNDSAVRYFHTLSPRNPKIFPLNSPVDIEHITSRDVFFSFSVDTPLVSAVKILDSHDSLVFQGYSQETLEHRYRFHNLAPDRFYSILIGRKTDSEDYYHPVAYPFRTMKHADTEPPLLIKGPYLSVNDSSCLIAFQVQEPAVSEIKLYEEETGLEQTGSIDVHETKHQYVFRGLSPGKTYSFEISLTDFNGNRKEKAKHSPKLKKLLKDIRALNDNTFTTNTESDGTPPFFTSPPEALCRYDSLILLGFTTNEPVFYDFVLKNSQNETILYKQSHDFSTENRLYLNRLDPQSNYFGEMIIYDLSENQRELKNIRLSTRKTAREPPLELIGQVEFNRWRNYFITTWRTDRYGDSRGLFHSALPIDQGIYLYQSEINQNHFLITEEVNIDSAFFYQVMCCNIFGERIFETPAKNQILEDIPPNVPLALTTPSTVEYSSDTLIIIHCRLNRPCYSLLEYSPTTDPENKLYVADDELSSSRSVILSHLTPDTEYSLKLTFTSLQNEELTENLTFHTENDSFLDTEKPLKPPDLEAQIQDDGLIKITWEKSPSPDVESYLLFRSRGENTESVNRFRAVSYYYDDLDDNNDSLLYKIIALDYQGNKSDTAYSALLTDVFETKEKKSKTRLGQNFPNPAKGKTSIKIFFSHNGIYRLKFYNILGKIMASKEIKASSQSDKPYHFDTSRWPPGIYFYRLTGPGNIDIKRKMIVF